MNKAADKPTTQSASGVKPLSAASVGLMLLDTSTRLFVPSIGGTVLGVWADNAWNTKPWFTIIGVTLGTVITFSLVYVQLHSIKIGQKESK